MARHIVTQNGQTHFKNLVAFAEKLLKCVWPFLGHYSEAAVQRCLKKRCSEICNKFTREQPCRSVISIKMHCMCLAILGHYALKGEGSCEQKHCSDSNDKWKKFNVSYVYEQGFV